VAAFRLPFANTERPFSLLILPQKEISSFIFIADNMNQNQCFMFENVLGGIFKILSMYKKVCKFEHQKIQSPKTNKSQSSKI
jgi:hypothetical protein